MEKDPTKRLGTSHGSQDLKEHAFFSDLDWEAVLERRCDMLVPPEPYLAQYAKNIIQVSPYMAAGHPQTRGLVIRKENPHYMKGWSFIRDADTLASV